MRGQVGVMAGRGGNSPKHRLKYERGTRITETRKPLSSLGPDNIEARGGAIRSLAEGGDAIVWILVGRVNRSKC